MVFITITEVIRAIILSFIVGFLFKDFFRTDLKTSTLLVAPSIILHELGHKTVAVFFGLNATFYAAWGWLFIALIMKYATGFVFLVPAYVSIIGETTPINYALIAFAGPAVNFILYGLAYLILNYKKMNHHEETFWIIFGKINLFLGVFNLIPIPGFDGYQVIMNLIKAIF